MRSTTHQSTYSTTSEITERHGTPCDGSSFHQHHRCITPSHHHHNLHCQLPVLLHFSKKQHHKAMYSTLQPTRRILFHLLVAALLSSRACIGFHLSTDVSPIGRRGTPRNAAPAARGPESFDLSSGLISQLAVAAIRARLRAHTSVKCEVSAKNNGLLA